MTVKLPYVKWRDGKPVFEPSPRERVLGFRSELLRHADGRWFSYEEAATWAIARQAKILEHRATGKKLGAPSLGGGRTVRDLLRDYLVSAELAERAAETQRSYRQTALAVEFKPMSQVDRLAGQERELEPFAIMPVHTVGPPEVRGFYVYLRKARGDTMARQVILLVSSAFKWGRLSPKWRLGDNPCLKLGLVKPAPRVVTWSLEELSSFIRCADAMGETAVADAVMIAVFTGQRKGDVLRLTEASIENDSVALIQSKRKARVEVPAIEALAARLMAMRARRPTDAAPNLILRQGKASHSKWTFRYHFDKVRTAAAAGLPEHGIAPMPSIAGKTFLDLRDTLLTWLKSAGARDDQFAAVSGHSLSSLPSIMPHYYAPGSVQAREAMTLLEDWMARKGMSIAS